MALYAMGDLHLSFGADKDMAVFDPVWRNHPEKIRKHWIRKVKEEDTIVLTGDFSWGKNLEESAPDFDFLLALPGRKIMLRGNHDMFWEAKKTEWLNETFEGRLFFLQNNYAAYGDVALVGTKGYCYEGRDPFEHFLKLREREMGRLEKSFEAARTDGFRRYIMFLHYPPTSIGEQESPFTRMAEKYGAEQVVYSHCHGEKRYGDSFLGEVNGIEYSLVSGDYLNFRPKKILE